MYQGQKSCSEYVGILQYANMVAEIHTSYYYCIQQDTELCYFKQSILCGAALGPNKNCWFSVSPSGFGWQPVLDKSI